MLKLKMMLCVTDASYRRRLHIKAVCLVMREATTASGVDNGKAPDWQTPLNDYFTLRREG